MAANSGTAVWAYKVGDAIYDYFKQKKEFEKQISTPEGLTKTQLAQKDMLQQKWNIGKYENPKEGVYANTKGYEDSMKTLGLEPYPLAMGGSGIVTKPTMFMMGENYRPERFNIQPVGNGKSVGMGGVNIENVTVVFPNVDLRTADPTMAKNLVVRAIRDAVTSGELNRSII